MPSILKNISNLCFPSWIYFIISILVWIILLITNLSQSTHMNIGNYHYHVISTPIMFLMQLIYIIFWTYVLNLICKDGHPEISWILVLLPFIVIFLMAFFIEINRGLF